MTNPISIQIGVTANLQPVTDNCPVYFNGTCVAVAKAIRFSPDNDIAGFELEGRLYRTEAEVSAQVAQGIADKLAEVAAREYTRQTVTVTGPQARAEGLTVSQALREIEAAVTINGYSKGSQAKIAAILKRAGLQDDTQAPADDIEAILDCEFITDQIAGVASILCAEYNVKDEAKTAEDLRAMLRFALKTKEGADKDPQGPRTIGQLLDSAAMQTEIDARIDHFRRVRYGVFGTKRGEAYRTLRDLIESVLTEAKAPAE